MRSIKKSIAVIVALCMVFTCFMAVNVSAKALNELVFTATYDKETVAPGDEVLVSLVSDADASIGFGSQIIWDLSSAENYVTVEPVAGTSGFIGSMNGNVGYYAFNVAVLGQATVVAGQPFAQFKVKFNADTPKGTYSFPFTKCDITDPATFDIFELQAPAIEVAVDDAPVVTDPPATEPPATQAPATQAPATQAPATQAPATEAPTAAPTEAPVVTQPPVSSTEFTIVIDGDTAHIPANVDKLVVRTDAAGDDFDYYVISRGADNKFTATLPKGYTYSITEIRDKDDNKLPLDVVNSQLTFDDMTDGEDVVVKEKEGEDAFTVTLKDDVKISAQADADVMGSIPEFTITVTTPVQDGEPKVEDVVYSDATKADFDLRLVDDHNIMVIYKGVAADKYIKVERTIDEFGVSIDNPRPNQVLPYAEKTVPGHYTVSTVWYLVDGENETAISDPEYVAEYRTTYRAEITIKLDHSLDVANEKAAKYYLNGALTEAPGPDGIIDFAYTTPGKGSGIGNSGFGTGGSSSSGTAATPVPSGAPVVAPTSAPVGNQVFEDVPPTYWAYDYIMDLYNAGIINGETATLFMPENNITRAEFTKIAVNVFALKATSTTSQFVDVTSSDWFAPFVIAATEAGLVNGISENEFAPNADITREQMATIIGRQMNMTSSNTMTYPDAASISDYAKEYVAGLSENGLLQGDETGNFRPQANAARSEAATLLDRVFVLTRSEEVPEEVPETSEAPEATAAPTAAPANNNGGFSTGNDATATPAATETAAPEASEAPEASATPAAK